MKMNDYKNVLNRMHPRETLENEIIEKALGTEKKTFRKRRFAPVIAVALSLCIGTLGVSAAMNYDWIKSFFEDDFVISEDIESLVAQTSNYECWSNCGIKMSLEGVVADEQSIYCKFNIDEMPEGYNIENLFTTKFASQSFDEINSGEHSGYGAMYDGSINEEGKFIVSYSSDVPMFKNRDKIAIHLANFESMPKMVEFATIYDLPDFETYPYDLMTAENLQTYDNDWDNVLIKFDLNFDDIPSLEISSEQMEIQTPQFDRIKITPFKMISSNHTTVKNCEPVKIVMKSGKHIVIENDDFSTVSYLTKEEKQALPTDENGFHVKQYKWIPDDAVAYGKQTWEFPEPINPENVAEIYIGDKCIYTK